MDKFKKTAAERHFLYMSALWQNVSQIVPPAWSSHSLKWAHCAACAGGRAGARPMFVGMQKPSQLTEKEWDLEESS
jgi:hypothetical protein